MGPAPFPSFVLAVALLGALLAAACGGAGGAGSPDLARVPTATLPNPLPEPTIIGGAPAVVGGTTYTIAAGDTLGVIADRFGTTVQALVDANQIADPTQLEVGQVLVIPEASAPPPEQEEPLAEEPTPPAPTAGPSGQQTYTVQSGDNAAAIADRFGITVDELVAANNTTIENIRALSVGDVLIIPAPGEVQP